MRGLALAAWIAAAACSAACSFRPGDVSSLDDASPNMDGQGSNIDATMITVDASPDAPPKTWQVVETITVNTASATPKTSTTVLASGVVYHLRVSGTINTVIDNHQGDADYYDFGAPKDLGCCEDIGLGIDDTVVNDKITLPDWGPYSASHIYEVEWTGDGTTITALFQDTYYANNVGNLTLEILEYK